MVDYNPKDIAEIARIYGELSVFYKMIEEGIEPRKNAERCLITMGNYRRTVPIEIQQALGINLNLLEKRCKEKIPKVA